MLLATILLTVPIFPASAAHEGETVFEILSSNIQQNDDEVAITLVYTQKISFTLLKSNLPQNWETEWEIPQHSSTPLSCHKSESNSTDTLDCQATENYGLVVLRAINKNNPSEVSNEFAITISSPLENDFISCIDPPENHTPSSCIDMFKNGEWDRNYSFSCLEGYEKEDNQCVSEENPPTSETPAAETVTEKQILPPAGYEDEVITNPEEYKNPFPDTNLSNLFGKAAAELYRRAIIGGFPDGEFKTDQEVNRAEAAKFLLLARYGSIDTIANNGKFPDVKEGEWYVPYVITAAQKGIINGHPDGYFRPQNSVKTVEFLKMLTLTFGIEKNLPHSYTDVDTDAWFAQYAGTAEEYNLFPERSTKLYPGSNLTRGEVAVAIYQYLRNR